jgi:hypothetical protein
MKTGKILLALIALVAIVGGLLAFSAKNYALNKMIAVTSAKSYIEKSTLVTVSPEVKLAHVKSIVRWADVCFSFTGNSMQYNDPSKYQVVPCSTIGGLCPGGAVFCGLKISDANLIHTNGQFIDKPVVDIPAGQGILDAIAEAVKDSQEAQGAGVHAYLKN